MTTCRLGSMIAAMVFAVAGMAAAQPGPSRYEVGLQGSVLRLSDFDTTNAGIGARFTVNLSRWAALEAEGSFYPQDDLALPPSSIPDLRIRHYRKRTEGFIGAKVGYRGERFGLFAKVRPGFSSLSERKGLEMCEGTACPLALLIRPEYRTELAMDLGGVLEFYPSSRLVARVELGDTIIRHRSIAPPCWGETCTSNNVTSKFGIGFGF